MSSFNPGLDQQFFAFGKYLYGTITCHVLGTCGGVHPKVFCVSMTSEFMDAKCGLGSVSALGNQAIVHFQFAR